MRLLAWIRFRRTAFSLMMRLQCSTFVMRGTPSSEAGQVGGAADRLERRARRSSSFRVTRSMGWLRSARAAMASKMRRCDSR